MLALTLLLLPALAHGSIRVYLKAASPSSGGHVEYLGANVDVVHDQEIASFGLTADLLREGVKSHTGSVPSHVFVKSPTIIDKGISENLYESYDFNEVTRRVIPMMGDIVREERELVDLSSEEAIYNNNDAEIVHKTTLVDNVIDKISVEWQNAAIVSQGDEINYVIDLGEDNVDKIENLTFNAAFGESFDKELDIELSKDVEVNIEPRSEASIHLKVEKVYLDVQLNYTVNLGGDVACYFPESHNGQQFWAFDVNEVLEAANMPKSLDISQLIKVVYYSNPRAEVVNA